MKDHSPAPGLPTVEQQLAGGVSLAPGLFILVVSGICLTTIAIAHIVFTALT